MKALKSDRLLALHLGARSVTGAVVRRVGVELEVERVATVDRGADLAAGLALAVSGLRDGPQLVPTAGPLPREAILVSGELTAVCLETPPLEELSDERVAGLVRWELEPILLGEVGAAGALPCGWAANRGGRWLFAAGVAAARRAELVGAVEAAGLRPVGLYPALACAPALLGAQADARRMVIEVSGGDGAGEVGCALVAGERVERFRLTRAEGRRPHELLASLQGEGAALLVAGPLPPEWADAVAELGGERLGPALEVPVPASLLGAARHALGLPGGERVPAIAARDPRPPLFRGAQARSALVLGAVAGLVLLVELGLSAWVARADGRLEDERREVGALQAEERRLKALGAERTQLRAELEGLRRWLTVQELAEGRRAYLPRLLTSLAEAAPPDLAVEGFAEQAGGALVLRGFSRDELAIQRFKRDLAAGVAGLGLLAGELTVREEPARLPAASRGALAPPTRGWSFTLRLQPSAGVAR